MFLEAISNDFTDGKCRRFIMSHKEHGDYLRYLLGRSVASLVYRKFFLYPSLSRSLFGRVLDVGCGIGDFLAYRPNSVGADINAEVVRFCNGRGLEAYLMQPDVLPFQQSDFDGVVLDNVIEHVPEPETLLYEIYRVLKPGGTLIVGVPGEVGYRSDPDHKVYYDESKLVDAIECCGFKAIRILPYPFGGLIGRRMRQYCLYGFFSRI